VGARIDNMGRGAGQPARGAGGEQGDRYARGTAGEQGDPWRSGRFALSGGAPLPRKELVEIQRSRLLTGAVGAIDELGYTRATVSQITARVGVSRRTFYEVFGDLEACLLALLEDVVGTIEEELRAEALADLAWCERVRAGLGAILAFLDRDPALARVCVVELLRAGPRVLERREQILARLALAIDAGRGESARAGRCCPLVAEGLVGGAFGILYTRLLRRERRPLRELEGELMSMIVAPYLGPAAVRRELERPPPAAEPAKGRPPARRRGNWEPLVGAPLRLTFRTARVLDCIAQRPGASNREVAEQAGIADAGQASKLLGRLAHLGLIANGGEQLRGTTNAWSLTPSGVQVAQSISAHVRQ
jgi:AcrR family transcriptional regulator/DNA-binding MarR family transcriptional regulator